MGIFENMLYEARPFIYGLIGVYSLLHFGNKTLVVCGVVLLACSTLVLSMRVSYRERMQHARIHSNNKASAESISIK